MAEDLLEKGAILQRDKVSYGIAPHIPGGIITDFNLLRRVADVAEKYGVKTIKLTSAQRFALIGLELEDRPPCPTETRERDHREADSKLFETWDIWTRCR